MNTRIIIGGFIILIGLSALFDFPIMRIAFALFIIWIGFRIMSGNWGSTQTFAQKTESEEGIIKRVVILSALNKKYLSQNFSGAEIVTILGGGEVDLSEVKTKQTELELNFVAILGGLKVIIPDNWSIHSEGVGILGGFDIPSKSSVKSKTFVTIKGAAILGGVEVVS